MIRITTLIVISQIFFACGQTEVRRTYYENGGIKSITEIKDDSMHGKHEFYYESGKLRSRGNYKMGMPSGLIEHFFENGNIKSRSYWLNGIEDGQTNGFFENGNPLFSAFYKQGKIIGFSLVYYENGNLRERKLYDSSGVLQHIMTYHQDGTPDRSLVVPYLEATKDTVVVGEETIVSIKFPFQLAGDVSVQASETDENGITVFEKDVYEFSDQIDSVRYKHTFNRPGEYRLSFRFNHINKPENDTLSVDDVIKDYRIVVLGSI